MLRSHVFLLLMVLTGYSLASQILLTERPNHDVEFERSARLRIRRSEPGISAEMESLQLRSQ